MAHPYMVYLYDVCVGTGGAGSGASSRACGPETIGSLSAVQPLLGRIALLRSLQHSVSYTP